MENVFQSFCALSRQKVSMVKLRIIVLWNVDNEMAQLDECSCGHWT